MFHMTLDDKVNVLLVIAVYFAAREFINQWKRMSDEDRDSEVESYRLMLPLLGTVGFSWMAFKDSGAGWAPWAALVSLAALIYGVVRIARRPPRSKMKASETKGKGDARDGAVDGVSKISPNVESSIKPGIMARVTEGPCCGEVVRIIERVTPPPATSAQCLPRPLWRVDRQLRWNDPNTGYEFECPAAPERALRALEADGHER